MERIKGFFRRLFRPAGREDVRRRWFRSCFWPIIGVIAAVVVFFILFALLVLRERVGETIAFAAAVGVAAGMALWLLGDRFLRGIGDSLRGLREQTGDIAAGRLGLRAEKLRDDEFGDLTDSINEMSAALARSEKMQAEFISSVSHELRTPLTAITGWAEALSFDDAIQGDSRRGIVIISKEASRLTKMVSELLEFTRIQDGRFTLNMETVDLAAEVEDAVLTYRSLLQQEDVALELDCDGDAVPLIQGDPERLKQVLLNILDNAAKYGKNGGSVAVAVKPEGEDVVVTVRDHGPGIPEAELPHVKEKFYKGSSRERGSGIGLAVCEEIVVRHGGTLTVENAEGGGVCVTVRLPAKQAA